MNLFKTLDASIKEVSTSRKDANMFFTKDDLIAYADYLQSQHIGIISVLESSLKSMSRNLAKEIDDNRDKYSLYVEFRKRLPANIKTAEAKAPFSTIITANKKFVEILNDLHVDIEKLFDINKINMLNTKTIHLVVIGVLRQSELISKFTKFIFAYVSSTAAGIDQYPKYRSNFILKNIDEIASAIGMVNADKGARDYRAVIDNIKSNASNYNLVDDKFKSQVIKISKAFKLTKNNSSLMTSGAFGLLSFRYIGFMINIIKNKIYKYASQEEEWMRMHVAILNSKLTGMPENDPDFVKLKKSIEKYESIIDKMERFKSNIQ